MPLSYPENLVSIGDHTRKKRMELKLLQKDLARICGVTEDFVTSWGKTGAFLKFNFFRIL